MNKDNTLIIRTSTIRLAETPAEKPYREGEQIRPRKVIRKEVIPLKSKKRVKGTVGYSVV